MSKTAVSSITKFYSNFVKSGDLCFDVGANIGDRTAALLKIGAKVVAFEPQPACVKKLKKRFVTKALIVPFALGAQSGIAVMQLTKASTIASMNPTWIEKVRQQRFKQYKWSESIEVPVETLDKMISLYGKPKFIKIDVEGFEHHVLEGLSQPIEYISFEVVPEINEIAINCIAKLQILGSVAFNYSMYESLQWMFKNWIGAEEMLSFLKSLQSPIFGDVYARTLLSE